MIPTTSDGLVLACAALTVAIGQLRGATAKLHESIEDMMDHDRQLCPPPARCVVVVHDSDATREAIVHMLLPLDAKIVACATSSEARLAILRERPALVVADYHLGHETCVSLLLDRPSWVRAMIVTGRVDVEDMADIAAGCGATVMQTPVTEAEERAFVALSAEMIRRPVNT